MQRDNQQEGPERQNAGDASLDPDTLREAGGREGSAPPGSSEIDASAGGHLTADNPALRVRRNAADILADQVREGDRENH